MKRLLLALVVLAGCKQPPTTVRVNMRVAPADPTPDAINMTVYDPYGVVVDDQPLADNSLPGDVVVVVSDDSDVVRLYARAKAADGRLLWAINRVKVRIGAETATELVLSTKRLGDNDGDGVPDNIDNCPVNANAGQEAVQGGPGDACGGGPPPDMTPISATQVSDMGGGGGDDLANNNTPPPDLAPVPGANCGDGIVTANEACDDGPGNSNTPSATGGCTTLCKKKAPCGALGGSSQSRVDPATGHCYVGWSSTVNWATAQRDCQARGGHLAAVTSSAENDIVKVVAGVADAWLGGTVEGLQTRWITGETLTFNGYGAGEPNDNDGAGTGEGCVVTTSTKPGWDDRPCGFPTAGTLPGSQIHTRGFVCEHACGNGVIEPGEGCDPPGPNCTATCQLRRPCTEAGGVVSPITGHCFFPLAAPVTYAAAKLACPVGTHLATVNDPAENEAAFSAAGAAETWIALRAPTGTAWFAWEAPSDLSFDSRRWHGFIDPEPNEPGEACTRLTPGMGWRDRDCSSANLFRPLCERD